MKLNQLYESHDVAKASCDFYCDPKAKKAGSVKKITNPEDPYELSFLVKGRKGKKGSRADFLKKMNKKAGKND